MPRNDRLVLRIEWSILMSRLLALEPRISPTMAHLDRKVSRRKDADRPASESLLLVISLHVGANVGHDGRRVGGQVRNIGISV